MARDIGNSPGNGGGTVLDKRRELDLRHQPVIGDDDDKALRRQRAGGKGIILPTPAVPAATIEEYHHGGLASAASCRRVNVEHLARVAAKGDVAGHPVGAAIARRKAVDGVERVERRTAGEADQSGRDHAEQQPAS